MPKPHTGRKRLNRRDWLVLAMEVLSKEGAARINIDHLCRQLGVTKGSFYTHFSNRADFVDQLITYWAESLTQEIIDLAEAKAALPPKERLLVLMQLIHQKRAAGYDTAVRAWAAQDSDVAKGVRAVDRKRFDYVKQIFHDIGFSGAELDLRTRLFVVYHSSQLAMRLPRSGMSADEEIKQRHEFFTRPST